MKVYIVETFNNKWEIGPRFKKKKKKVHSCESAAEVMN